jgi:hypothetical protein
MSSGGVGPPALLENHYWMSREFSPLPGRSTGFKHSSYFLSDLISRDQLAGVIRRTGPFPLSFVSRTATCPGTLATSTHSPPEPPL